MASRSKTKSSARIPLNRERVLRAAIAIADELGIDALTMRKLAQAVAVEAMSLYNHVANKDDVLDGMTDIAVGEIEVPEVTSDWRAEMRRRAISAHEVLLQHPWATMLIVSRVNVGPAMLRYVDATIGCLREAGFSFEAADRAWNAIDSHIYGFTLQRLNFPFEPSEYQAAATQYLPIIAAENYPYLEGMTRQVSAGAHHGVNEFEFGLDILLDGLERVRASA